MKFSITDYNRLSHKKQSTFVDRKTNIMENKSIDQGISFQYSDDFHQKIGKLHQKASLEVTQTSKFYKTYYKQKKSDAKEDTNTLKINKFQQNINQIKKALQNYIKFLEKDQKPGPKDKISFDFEGVNLSIDKKVLPSIQKKVIGLVMGKWLQSKFNTPEDLTETIEKMVAFLVIHSKEATIIPIIPKKSLSFHQKRSQNTSFDYSDLNDSYLNNELSQASTAYNSTTTSKATSRNTSRRSSFSNSLNNSFNSSLNSSTILQDSKKIKISLSGESVNSKELEEMLQISSGEDRKAHFLKYIDGDAGQSLQEAALKKINGVINHFNVSNSVKIPNIKKDSIKHNLDIRAKISLLRKAQVHVVLNLKKISDVNANLINFLDLKSENYHKKAKLFGIKSLSFDLVKNIFYMLLTEKIDALLNNESLNSKEISKDTIEKLAYQAIISVDLLQDNPSFEDLSQKLVVESDVANGPTDTITSKLDEPLSSQNTHRRSKSEPSSFTKSLFDKLSTIKNGGQAAYADPHLKTIEETSESALSSAKKGTVNQSRMDGYDMEESMQRRFSVDSLDLDGELDLFDDSESLNSRKNSEIESTLLSPINASKSALTLHQISQPTQIKTFDSANDQNHSFSEAISQNSETQVYEIVNPSIDLTNSVIAETKTQSRFVALLQHLMELFITYVVFGPINAMDWVMDRLQRTR